MKALSLLKYYGPALLWGALILILVGMPGNFLPQMRDFSDWLTWDKIVHFCLFSPFAFLIAQGVDRQYGRLTWHSMLVILVILVSGFYGGLTELLQLFVFKGRDGNIYDFLANMAGSLLGIILYTVYRKLKLKYADKEKFPNLARLFKGHPKNKKNGT